MNIVIKKFEEFNIYELYEILKIRSEVFVLEQKCAYQDIDGADLDSYHLIGYEDKEICAYLRIPLKGVVYEKTSIGRVVIPTKSRGKGHGREIFLKAIDIVINKIGEDEIEISAQLYLQKFYESCGFKTTSMPYLEDGIEHIHMNFIK